MITPSIFYSHISVQIMFKTVQLMPKVFTGAGLFTTMALLPGFVLTDVAVKTSPGKRYSAKCGSREVIWMLSTLLFSCAGAFTVFCAAKDYDWFIESRKARLFLTLFGRTGARICYAALGIILIVCAFLIDSGPKK